MSLDGDDVKRLARRIVVHDGSGHPFQVELSRELARRGNHVLHLHFSGFQTPKGSLQCRPDDPPTFDVRGLNISAKYEKYSLFRRRQQEIEYGHVAAETTLAFKPDIVIAANLSIETLRIVQKRCASTNAFFVTWAQDIYSAAMQRILPARLPIVGHLAAAYYTWLEGRIFRNSDHVVGITDDFADQFNRWRLPTELVTTIENWSPLDEIVPMPNDNAWARAHGLVGKHVILYSGTLGLKHNPSLITDLCAHFADSPGVEVVVVSEGLGADWLRQEKESRRLLNLTLLPFQPYNRFSEVLASATIFVALIEPDAGVYSVPSKVLSYLCAGRPIVLSVPAVNLAARTVERADAGVVVPPDNPERLCREVRDLLEFPERMQQLARQGRAYAERTFKIAGIADRFEAIWQAASANAATATSVKASAVNRVETEMA